MSRVTAVVPLRDGRGKTRLAPVLPGESRRRVVEALARHVVGTLLEVAEVDRVLIVTSDGPFVAETLSSADRRVVVVEQPADRPGLDAAADVGRELASTDRLLVIHADLPALTAADVRALLAEAVPVVLATDRLGTGTNAVLLGPGSARFGFAFGPDSLRAHLDEARRRGLASTVVRRDGTGTDLDTEDDWAGLPSEVRARLLG